MGKANHLKPIHTGGTTSITTRRTPAENRPPARTANGHRAGETMTANPELTGRTPVFSWPLAGCAQDSSMNCASTPDGGAVPGDVPADSGGATPVTRTDAVGWLGCEKIRKGSPSVPVPDSYPHVTCGCPVTGRCPRGVVAVVAPAAPKARHGIDDNTGTLAASAPARRTGPRTAGQQPRCPARSRVRQAGLGARTAPGGLVPVVSVLFPEPGRGLPGPGKAVRAVR